MPAVEVGVISKLYGNDKMLNAMSKIFGLGVLLCATTINAEKLEAVNVLKFTSTDDKTQGETCFLLQEKVQINWDDLVSSGVTDYPSESYLNKNLWKYKQGSSAHYKFNAPLPDNLKGKKYFVFGVKGAGVVEATHIKGTAVYEPDYQTSSKELSLIPKFRRARLCFDGNGGINKPLFVAKINSPGLPVKVELKQKTNTITFNFLEVATDSSFTTSMHNFIRPKTVMYKDAHSNKYLAISYPDINQCGEEWQLVHIANGKTKIQDYKGGNSC